MSETIYHNHHITPKHHLRHKSIDFINDPSNLVRVTLNEHAALHKWLYMLRGSRYDIAIWRAMETGKFYCDWTGLKHSEESKLKISESSKGRCPWNKNKKMSQKYKDTCSKAQQKRFETHPVTDHTKQLNSKQTKKMWSELGRKEAYTKNWSGKNNSFYGKTHTKEWTLSRQKQVSINGIIYPSHKVASNNLQIPHSTIRSRIKSKNKKFEDYFFI